jgi:hypothetical protein
MSHSRQTEFVFENEAAADAAAADAAAADGVARSPNSDAGDLGPTYDLESDADSMPVLEGLCDTDSIMESDADSMLDHMLPDLLHFEQNGTYFVREYQRRGHPHIHSYFSINHTHAVHLDAAPA